MANDVENNMELLKQRSVDAAIKALKKKFGENIIMRLDEILEVDYVPTRFTTLNRAIGLGGIPIGLVTEIVGDEGCGKTTLALSLTADAQRHGLQCMYLDLEGKVRMDYARTLGVKGDLLLVNPKNGDEAMKALTDLLPTGAIGFAVVDSVALLSCGAEWDKEIYESNMAMTARLMSQSLRRIIPLIRKNGCALVFINQYRQSVGKMFGNPNQSTGGRALQYASSLKLELRDGKMIYDSDGGSSEDKSKPIGKNVKVKISKNQVGTPFADCNLTLFFGAGFDPIYDLFQLGLDSGVLRMAGSWVKMGDENMAHGKEDAIEKMREDDKLCENILKLIDIAVDSI